ncbi:MAG: 5'/3'-nucleotidase SurE [Myxococcota bacterium]
MAEKPFVLVSNDDGADAEGIRALAEALRAFADVLVVAPDRERSGTSHAISLARPLRVSERGADVFAVDGTPVDCVYLGLLHLAPRRPAVVVSGVNHGYNLGADVFYSGTVAAAIEAAIRGVPAIAVSLAHSERDFTSAASFAAAAVAALLDGSPLPPRTLLNVNVPPGRPTSYRVTRLGHRVYRDRVEERSDLRGRRYFWIGGPDAGHADVAGSDCEAIAQGRISVTPLGLDLTEATLLAAGLPMAVEGFPRSAV